MFTILHDGFILQARGKNYLLDIGGSLHSPCFRPALLIQQLESHLLAPSLSQRMQRVVFRLSGGFLAIFQHKIFYPSEQEQGTHDHQQIIPTITRPTAIPTITRASTALGNKNPPTFPEG
jgi:hypothetical protein